MLDTNLAPPPQATEEVNHNNWRQWFGRVFQSIRKITNFINMLEEEVNSVPHKNLIINGNFSINQRAVTGSVSLSSGEYGHDRWKAGASGCSYTFSTSANITTIVISTGTLVQVVEGGNLYSDDYTLVWEGTAQGRIGGGSYGDSAVTEAVTGGSNLSIEFGTGTVAQVHLVRGEKGFPPEARTVGEELSLCQRYYYRASFPTVNFWADVAGRYFTQTIVFHQTMRDTPAISHVFTGTLNACVVNSLSTSTTDSFRLLLRSTGAEDNCYVDPASSDYFAADAEL